MEVLNCLFTSSYYEDLTCTPSDKLTTIGADIRAAHPEKYTPITPSDPRFDHPSWMSVHAWALPYLTLWCVKPVDDQGNISTSQYLISLTIKPIASVFDATANTLLLPLKLIGCADRGMRNLMSSMRLIEDPTLPSTMTSLGEFGTHCAYTCISLVIVLLQPIYIGTNLISPKQDMLLRNHLGWCYPVTGPKGQEMILDQNRVKYLRERCGWQSATDELLKAYGNLFLDRYAVSYKDGTYQPWVSLIWSS